MDWDVDRVMNQMALKERIVKELPTQNYMVSVFPLFCLTLLWGPQPKPGHLLLFP